MLPKQQIFVFGQYGSPLPIGPWFESKQNTHVINRLHSSLLNFPQAVRILLIKMDPLRNLIYAQGAFPQSDQMKNKKVAQICPKVAQKVTTVV